MPELPEVEVTRQGLLQHLPGRLVTDISWSACRLRKAIPAQLLVDHIRGKRILTIDRRAKYLLVRMAEGAVLLIHLGMTGKLSILPASATCHRHDHCILGLDDGHELRFNDSRRFGLIEVWPAEQAREDEQNLSKRQGVEPLDGALNQTFLMALGQRYSAPVKTVLMNSRIIAGIGNIYANEILFAARISPLMAANKVSPADWQRIAKETVVTLRSAIAAGGSTIADFLGANGNPGYFQLRFQVYGRKELPCFRCGHSIVKTTLGGRATYYCPTCQPQK